MTLSRFTGAIALLLFGAPALAQDGVGAPCAHPAVPGEAAAYCFTAAQALKSAQPQLGILIAGGNPTIGAASAGGLRLGILPGVGAGLNLNLVFVRLPEIRAEEAGSGAGALNDAVGISAPALSGTASIGLFPGYSAAPTVGGIGSVDLLGSASWLPFSEAHEGFEEGTAELAYGGGVRIGLLRESFGTPAVSVSVMYRRLGEVAYGDVCPSFALFVVSDQEDYSLASGICASEGDAGEFAADLSDWSTRATVGKRLLGLAMAAGVGYDRFSSDVRYGFRAPSGSVAGAARFVARASEMELDAGRWSAFANAGYTALVATFAVEAGWLQGGDAIDGFPTTSDFDPGEGTFFGSLGLRVAL